MTLHQTRKVTVAGTAAAALALLLSSSLQPAAAQPAAAQPAAAQPAGAQQAGGSGQAVKPPIVLREQGAFFVGGTIQTRTPASSNPADDSYFLPGDIAVDQMYVEYQIPAELKYKYPIILMHGGGHTGAVYQTKPDGGEGWFTSFTRRGFAVYVVDAPNRGRSGWDPTARYAVGRGQLPPAALQSSNIYSAQAAWKAFRFGPEYPTRFPGQQFPTDHLQDYLRQAVPSYRDPRENPLIAQDLGALMKRIGPSILLGWSTGAGNVMTAASADMDNTRAIVTIEVTGTDMPAPAIDPARMAKVPFLSVFGDYRTADLAKQYIDKLAQMGGDATNVMLPDVGIKGNGHAMMLERNSEQIADFIEQWVGKHVPN